MDNACFSFFLFPRDADIYLLEEFRDGHFLVVVLVQDLRCREIKVLLCDMYPSLAQCVHARFGTYTLQFCSRAPVHLLCDLC